MSYKVTVSNLMKSLARVAGFGVLIKASSLVKASFIVGSQHLFFSGVNSAVPAVGALGGTLSSMAVWILRIVASGSMDAKILALTVPGLAASLYWSVNHWSVRFALPAVCMAAFCLHPVGGQAAVYALYWLIPMALYLSSRTSLFTTSLAATFTAHAVGSVLWLYIVPSTPDMWIALIPVVMVERLCFASGTVVLYHAVTLCAQYSKQVVAMATRARCRTSH